MIYEPLFCNWKCDLVEVFVAKGFLSVFETAEDQTKENRITKGYVGISLGFLRNSPSTSCWRSGTRLAGTTATENHSTVLRPQQ